ncbi:unnamed protein product [Cylicocyclus nassatus]|uniref:Uncharacterized protein n=1 Tax=Cylicocyclus nassatus TaxID=53992 RepID=A0AA36DKR7_CYLNA|nr:unnamed protein product [Cylicocyclus nassatus]
MTKISPLGVFERYYVATSRNSIDHQDKEIHFDFPFTATLGKHKEFIIRSQSSTQDTATTLPVQMEFFSFFRFSRMIA